jgi:DNA-binding transcriptional ArsR family regulator
VRRGVQDPQAVHAAAARIASLRQEIARETLRAASDLNRLRVIRALDGSALAAGDLAAVIGRSPAATSQHLAVLRRLDVVSATRAGNMVRYRLTDSIAARVLLAIARAFDPLAR